MAAFLAPAPKFYEHDANGAPLSSGKVYTYVSGSSSTPLATYTSATGGTPNTNPVILDSTGRADIWLNGTGTYRFVVQNSASVEQYTVDGITGSASILSIQSGAYNYLTAVAGTNTVTATATPAVTAYTTGQLFNFTPANTNTGATTLNINSVGAASVYANNIALTGGEMRASVPVIVQYDGARFQIVGDGAFISPAGGAIARTRATASTTGILTVDETFTGTSGTDYGFTFSNTSAHTGASTATVRGGHALVTANSTGTLLDAQGMSARVVNANTGNLATGEDFHGASINLNSSGNIAVAACFGAYQPTLTSTGVPAIATGFHCNPFTTGTVNYGFWSEVAAGSGRWAFIGTGTADSSLLGGLTIGANTAPGAVLDVTGGASSAFRVTSSKAVGSRIGTINSDVDFYPSDATGANAANAVLKVMKVTATSRSIAAAGTIDASGSDLAEAKWKRKDCGKIERGQVCGLDADGRITDKFSLMVNPHWKTGANGTEPGFTMGDDWGSPAARCVLDNLPLGERPQFEQNPPKEPTLHLMTGDSKERIAYNEQAKRIFKTESAQYADNVKRYEAAIAAFKVVADTFEKRYQANRERIDRLVYAGTAYLRLADQVGGMAATGDYIVLEQGSGDAIKWRAVSRKEYTFEQSHTCIGRVERVDTDGTPLVKPI